MIQYILCHGNKDFFSFGIAELAQCIFIIFDSKIGRADKRQPYIYIYV